MPVCILRATGRSFDIEWFVASLESNPKSVFKPGRDLYVGQVADEFGFIFTIGHGSIEEEIPHAIAFLRQHQGELTHLKAWSGVDTVTLEFGWDCPYGRTVRIYNRFPPDLLSECAALGIGIEVLLYFVDESEFKRPVISQT
ncbi:MAG: hypothetical protein C0467_09700 [Planctomycetaceae bacterium]|nr:hypothetical protein [Planctomycetaceae bacterium]